MLFVIGMALFLFGAGVFLFLGSGLRFSHNRADIIGSWIVVGGVLIMLASLATIALRYLP